MSLDLAISTEIWEADNIVSANGLMLHKALRDWIYTDNLFDSIPKAMPFPHVSVHLAHRYVFMSVYYCQ